MYNKSSVSVGFIYTSDEIFDATSLMSTYMTKDIKTKEGQSLFEELSLSPDERNIFEENFKTIRSQLYELLQTHLGSELISLAYTTTLNIVIKANSNYTDNNLILINEGLKETIIEGCLSEWFKTCGYEPLYKLSAEKYLLLGVQLRNRLFLLKKKRAI